MRLRECVYKERILSLGLGMIGWKHAPAHQIWIKEGKYFCIQLLIDSHNSVHY